MVAAAAVALKVRHKRVAQAVQAVVVTVVQEVAVKRQAQ
jgi:hypothetical protein